MAGLSLIAQSFHLFASLALSWTLTTIVGPNVEPSVVPNVSSAQASETPVSQEAPDEPAQEWVDYVTYSYEEPAQSYEYVEVVYEDMQATPQELSESVVQKCCFFRWHHPLWKCPTPHW